MESDGGTGGRTDDGPTLVNIPHFSYKKAGITILLT